MNTMIAKTAEHQWTHWNGINRRQIDYFCCDRMTREWVSNVHAAAYISVGADHRALRMTLRITGVRTSKRRRKHTKKKSLFGWRPSDPEAYKIALDHSLRMPLSGPIHVWHTSAKR